MTHDRTYWRACDDKRLIDEARDSGNELTIALGERLADRTDAHSEASYWRDRFELARGANVALRAELEAYEEAYQRERDETEE